MSLVRDVLRGYHTLTVRNAVAFLHSTPVELSSSCRVSR
jgi:hypothetical protein